MPETTYRVKIGDTERTVKAGTPILELAKEAQSAYQSEIVLAMRSGKLCELNRTIDRDCTLSFVTVTERPGWQTYERSALLLLMRAFYDVAGAEHIRRIVVDHAVSNALYVRAEGDFALTDALLSKVEARMREVRDAREVIRKESLPTDDAIELFKSRGMDDKARLLRFRVSSRVNVYWLGDYVDYFYGYMLPDAGYLHNFELRKFEGGFVLILPEHSDPKSMRPFKPSMKVFGALNAATKLNELVHIPDVGALNEGIAAGNSTQLVLSQEAMMEKKIGDIAEMIAARPDVRFVMIAGPSSSGKTTFSHRLSTQLRACGLTPYPIATDNYFRGRAETPRDADGNYDFECLEAVDVPQFNEDMTRLLNGERVELPRFNFKKGEREYQGDYLQLAEGDVLVIEGIHCLNDALSYALPGESKFKIYISALTSLNVDDHNRIPTTDARLLRRIVRDARTRGYPARATIDMWPSVRRGEESHIFPFQDSADVVFNSALLYETALIKTYAEPLLFNVPPDSDAYLEAKRLLKFLSYFLTIPAEAVPTTSLAREFIGGGIYDI